jgi:hypothetical protein
MNNLTEPQQSKLRAFAESLRAIDNYIEYVEKVAELLRKLPLDTEIPNPHMKDQPSERARFESAVKYIETTQKFKYTEIPGRKIIIGKNKFGDFCFSVDTLILFEDLTKKTCN